jgi:lipopolysaccharide export system protein LptA
VASLAQDAPTPADITATEGVVEQRGESILGGDRPFRLTTDPDGDVTYNIDDETKELRSLVARKNVVFVGEDLSLNADQLEYDAITGELVAVGRRVVVRQGEITVTCQLFRYNPSTQQSEMLGNPTIYNKGRDGKINFMSGERIVILRTGGRTQVKVFGAPGRAPVLTNSQDGALTVPSGATIRNPSSQN